MIQQPTSTVDYPLQHPGTLGTAPKQSSGILPTAILFAASLIYFLVSVHIGWHHTISDAYAFRQSQTAITVDSMLRGGPWLIYKTPVLGPPWTIPFEFPVFQWIVAILTWSTGIAIEPAGRTVSVVFFLLTLWPTDRILSKLHISLACRLTMLSLLLCSPFYIFWSRTFLIESTALFFAVSSLAYTLHVVYHPSIARLVVLASIAGLAALVKITTFLPFLLASVVIIFYQLRCTRKSSSRSPWLPQVATSFAGVVFPALVLFAWTITIDHAKSHSILGQRLVSTQLNSWTFGTLQQRLSAATWIQFADRVQLPIGYQFSVILPLLTLIIARHRWIETFGFLLLYLVGPLTFTNLFYIHEYYYFANNIFLILAIGLVIVAMIERGQHFKTMALAAVVLVVGSMVTTYYQLYRPIQSHNVLTYQRFGALIQKATANDDVIIIQGVDWSPEIPYYSRRRALCLPVWADTAEVDKCLHSLKASNLGALVISPPGGKPFPAGSALAFLQRNCFEPLAISVDVPFELWLPTNRAIIKNNTTAKN